MRVHAGEHCRPKRTVFSAKAFVWGDNAPRLLRVAPSRCRGSGPAPYSPSFSAASLTAHSKVKPLSHDQPRRKAHADPSDRTAHRKPASAGMRFVKKYVLDRAKYLLRLSCGTLPPVESQDAGTT